MVSTAYMNFQAFRKRSADLYQDLNALHKHPKLNDLFSSAATCGVPPGSTSKKPIGKSVRQSGCTGRGYDAK